MALLIPAGAVVLSPADAQMLYQAARMWELRCKYRTANPRLFEVLTTIAKAATITPDNAAPGNSPRQNAASEKTGYSTKELATITGLAERTIRLACHKGELEGATCENGRWRIPAPAAQTFITTRR